MHGQTAKLIARIAENLPEMPNDLMQEWIEKPRELQKGLRTLFCPSVKAHETGFPIWKTIKLGTGLKTADDFRRALHEVSCRIGDYADDIFGKPGFTAAEKETEINLVRVTVSELGFNCSTRFDKICAQAKEQGLELCPAEVGPQLPLQYLNQPLGERIIVAMEPIADSDGYPVMFYVEHVEFVRWLRTGYVRPGGVFPPDCLFVFRPRK